MRLCIHCGKAIPAVRIAVLPNTETCVGCSVERPLTEDELPVDGADLTDRCRVVSQGRSES